MKLTGMEMTKAKDDGVVAKGEFRVEKGKRKGELVAGEQIRENRNDRLLTRPRSPGRKFVGWRIGKEKEGQERPSARFASGFGG